MSRDGSKPPTTIHVRAPEIVFDDSIPRNWYARDFYATALLDALSLVIPAGERFFIRCVKPFEKRLKDPVKLRELQAFIGQEAAHSRVHGEHAELLFRRGHSVRKLVKEQEGHYRLISRILPARLLLSITCGMEHFTSVMASATLSTHAYDTSHPAMRDLWYWHAAEEIEHKSVAFDTLQAVAPRNYPLRALGFIIGTLLLAQHTATFMKTLLEDQGYDRAGRKKLVKGARRSTLLRPSARRLLLKAYFAYLRPGFHPDQHHDRHLAANYFRTHKKGWHEAA